MRDKKEGGGTTNPTIRTVYPDAIDHKGLLLTSHLDELESSGLNWRIKSRV